jgi:acyl-CoA thioesterase-1
MTTPVKLETATDPSKIEQSTASYQGLAKIMEPTTIRALVLGDSVAESLGVSNRDLSSWHTLVANALHTNYPGTIQWHFKTSAAASINDVLTFVPEATIDTDLIVLCLGRQDVGRLRLTVFKQKYEQLIVELKAKSPHADLYLVVEPPVLSNSENTKFLAYRKIINDLGQKHQLHVIDAWTAFINDPTPLSGLLADSVYPNDKGYRVFADAIIKGFTDYLALQAD